MNMNLAYVLFLFALWVSYYVGFQKQENQPPAIAPKVIERKDVPEKLEVPAPRASEVSRAEPTARGPSLNGDQFKKKYGDHLEQVVTPSGRVLAFRAIADGLDAWEKAQRDPQGFKPRDREAVIRRSGEIIADARDLLGLDPEFPLGNPELTHTDFSASVSYEELHKGIPLSQGRVTVLLGPAGELRSIESDYVRGGRIQNRAPARVPTEGRTVLWVGDRREDSAELYYAKEVRKSGIQTVTDLETGRVIYTRNRRMH